MWLKAKETGPSKPIRQTEPHSKRLYWYSNTTDRPAALKSLDHLSSRLTFHIWGLFWHISELLLAVLNEQSRFIQQVSKLRLKGAYWTIVPRARAECDMCDMCPVLYWHPSPCSPDCYKCDKLLIGKTLGSDTRGFVITDLPWTQTKYQQNTSPQAGNCVAGMVLFLMKIG